MHKLEYSYKYSHNFPAAAPAVSVGNNSLDHHLLQRIITANAVVIFSRSTCCMCHAVKHLFCGMGVHPTVYELDEDNPRSEKELEKALMRLLTAGGGSAAVPVVFIGGKLVGGMDRVMGSHINGSLVPLLKQAGALWL